MSNAKLWTIAAVLAVWLFALPIGSSFLRSVSAGDREQQTHDEHGHSHIHEHAPNAQSERMLDHPSVSPWGWLGLYSLLIAAASLFGGWLPGHLQLSHLRFQLVMSVIGGLILGIGVLHLLPHALHDLGQDEGDSVAKWMMVGMVTMFFLLRAFHVHHHPPEIAASIDNESSGVFSDRRNVETRAGHDHSHNSQCDHAQAPRGRLSWAGLFFGLAVHTLMDGLALGATLQAESQHGNGPFIGLGILLAIALHKPLDSLSITTLMTNAGKSTKARWIVNLVYTSLCPIGAAAFLLGVGQMSAGGHFVVGCSLAFSAGVFICIALADLLPEMEFHSHNRVRLSIALLLGIGLAWAIQFLEPAHLHY